MPQWKARIKGTINEELIVDIDVEDDEDAAMDEALFAWMYTEYESLWVESIERIDEED